MGDRFFADPPRLAEHAGPLDRLISGADGVRPVSARLDLAAGLDGGGRELGRDLIDVLLDDAPLGRDEEPVFEVNADRAHHREDAGDLARLGGDGAQQLELLLDGNREGVGGDLGAIGIAVGRGGRQLDRLETQRGVGPRDLDGLDGGAGDGLAGHFVRGREPPGAVGEHAKPEAERSRVRDRGDLDGLAGGAVGLHAKADVLAAIAVDANIGVGGAGGPGPLDGKRRQLAELADVELGGRRGKARPVAVGEGGPHRRAGAATTEKCTSSVHCGRLLRMRE